MTALAGSASTFQKRTITYWVATAIIATECVVGGVMGALQLPPFIGIIRHLGYPSYFMSILGVWYVLAGLALLAPGFPRLKEWAYAGLIFNYTGAVASHLAAGDGAAMVFPPILFIGLVAASWALRPPGRRDVVLTSTSYSKSRAVGYWATTAMITLEQAAGGVMDLVRGRTEVFAGPSVVEILKHLGYPVYLLTILAVWKLLGVIALLVPRLPRLKEWAYAGIFFEMTGAAVSWVIMGDNSGQFIVPLIFAVLAMISWALRPPSRTFGLTSSASARS